MSRLDALAPHWAQISALLDEALTLPEQERAAWLDTLDVERARFKPALLELLGAPAQAQARFQVETGDFLERLPRLRTPRSADAGDALADEPAPGRVIGRYRLLRELGHGGMGDVWLAERADGQLGRHVALKLPRLAWGSALRERLARERDILASLEHPNIARLYDADVDAQGRPWLAMEFVDGQPIDVHARERHASLRDRIGLLLQVCEAVAHAHARLVIHRDLKPANILVTADGRVRLLDFGIAKLMDGDRTAETALTREAGRALSLDYASPEQISSAPLGTASDVYSLGVVAYELLSGAKPYRLKRGTSAELEEAIAAVDPPRASEATTDLRVKGALHGDIDAILNKALKKHPQERYASVEALAEDIQRHLRHEAVLAQPDRLAYRAAKFLQRHRLPVAAGAVTLAALVAGTAVAWTQALRAEAERQHAELAATLAREQTGLAQSEAERARAVSKYLGGLFRAANPGQASAQQMQAMTAVQLLDRGVAQVDELSGASPAVRLELLREFADANAGLGRYAQSLTLRQRVVAEAESLHGVGSLQALTQRVYLARTLSLLGRRDEAVREIDSALTALAESHPQSGEYADALIGSAGMFQSIDPVRSLRDAEQSVRLSEAIAAQAAGGRSDSGSEERYRSALFQLGLQQQTGGALRQSLVTLDTAAERSTAMFGSANRYSVDVRTRRLYSLLALGNYAEVVREAPALAEAAAGFDAASAMLVPQVRLYHARALSALGRHADAEQQVQMAIAERVREPNSAISPRLDTFQGLLWVVRLDAQPQADAVRALEAMLEAGEGVAATRMLWATSLVPACLALNDRPCAERQAARAASLANVPAATPEMKLEQLVAAAQLSDTTTPTPQLDALLAALLSAEAAAESDHGRARLAWARAVALHRSGRSAEAAAALQRRRAAGARLQLQHAGLRAQMDALAATLQPVLTTGQGKTEPIAPR